MLKVRYNVHINIFRGRDMAREGKARVLSDAEFKRVLRNQVGKKHQLRNIALLYFSYGLGLRAKELSCLVIEDVRNPDSSLKDEIYINSKKTKGNKGRAVYLTNRKIINAIENYLDTRAVSNPKEALFLSQKSGKFSPNTMQMLFSRIYKDAGIVGASSHSGRRSFATKLITSGADIKAVSRLMGHRSVTMTASYVSDNPDRLKKLSMSAI